MIDRRKKNDLLEMRHTDGDTERGRRGGWGQLITGKLGKVGRSRQVDRQVQVLSGNITY